MALERFIKSKPVLRGMFANVYVATPNGQMRAASARVGGKRQMSASVVWVSAEAVGAHKTSMLQDVEHGRALELEALVGAVVELGRITATPTPTIEAIYAATSLLAASLRAASGGLVLRTA